MSRKYVDMQWRSADNTREDTIGISVDGGNTCFVLLSANSGPVHFDTTWLSIDMAMIRQMSVHNEADIFDRFGLVNSCTGEANASRRQSFQHLTCSECNHLSF